MTYARTEPTDQEPDIRARPPLVREFLLVAGLFLAYKFGRRAANGHVEEAFRNAGNVWDLERALQATGDSYAVGAAHPARTPAALAHPARIPAGTGAGR